MELHALTLAACSCALLVRVRLLCSCVPGILLVSFPDHFYHTCSAKSGLGMRLGQSYDFLPHRTALHWASKRGHLSVVRYLLQKGAEVNLKSHKGELPMDVASTTEVAKILSGKHIRLSSQTENEMFPVR